MDGQAPHIKLEPIDTMLDKVRPKSFSIPILLLGISILCIAGIVWWVSAPPAAQYVTAPITKGNIIRAIVTTGTINPVTTVQVGSYVSGTIQTLLCDYNTKVTAGQLCATIDPRPYQVIYDGANANLANAQAQLDKDKASLIYAKLNYLRDKELQRKGIVSQDALDNDKSAYDQAGAQIGVDQATIKQRQAALQAAQVNIDYTKIVSPVDGTVVSRSIDVGQTVASSFQTPTLFLIAKDLTKMQVDTNVSETDVGRAKIGQKALFIVEAYPDKTFEGLVRQVRQAPITVQNVVTYNVVISVDNPDLQLLPGMTANTRIVSEEHDDVLRVPVQALRFMPNSSDKKTSADKIQSKPRLPRVFILQNGKPESTVVTVGISDGVNAEISGENLQVDDQVIINELKAGDAKKGAAQNTRLRL